MEPASIAAILAASAASSAASMYNNRQNIRYAQEANDEMVGLANTAHQREVRDLIAAGLNPILSATGSGAATPSLRVPNLESIDGGIASSASALGRAVSIQQGLENQALDIDNGLQALELRKRDETFQPDMHSAIAEANKNRTLAEYEDELISDKMAALHDLKYAYESPDGRIKIIKDSYKKDVRDSVNAEVKESGTKYLQGWSNHVKGWLDTGIELFNSAKGFGGARLRNEILRKRLERMR